MDPEIQALGLQLANIGVRNTATTITQKIEAIKSKRKDQETISTLEEIVNDLINDRSELVRIAKAYEDELVSQRISSEDIDFISTNLFPVLEDLLKASNSSNSPMDPVTLELIKRLLSVETVTILQLLGFNFRQAVGEPLTSLVADLITSKTPSRAKAKPAGGQSGRR